MIEHRILGIHQFCCNFCCWGVECKIFELLYSLPVAIVIEICTLVRQSKQCKCIFPAKISYLTFFQGKFFRVFAGVCQINLSIDGFNIFFLFNSFLPGSLPLLSGPILDWRHPWAQSPRPDQTSQYQLLWQAWLLLYWAVSARCFVNIRQVW